MAFRSLSMTSLGPGGLIGQTIPPFGTFPASSRKKPGRGPMFVDSHCHLDYHARDGDLADVVARARAAGVGEMVTICTKISEFDAVSRIAAQFDGVWCTLGVHPHEAGNEPRRAVDEIVGMADHPKVVGIGETGLDYYYERSPRKAQRRSFQTHIDASRRTGLPLIVHARDADDDIIEMLGEAIGSPDQPVGRPFQRGVSTYPVLGDAIRTTPPLELAQVYARPMESNLPIGAIFQDDSLPAYVLTDELLGKHFGVLGTTGSGKSCTVALILHRLLEEYPNGHIVLLDPHNEYMQSFGELAEPLNPDTIHLPYWLLNFDEIRAVLVGKDHDDAHTQALILRRIILLAKQKLAAEQSAESASMTIDTPVPYRLGDMMAMLDEEAGRLDNPEASTPYMRLKSRLESLQGDRRFNFMFSGLLVRDSLADIVSQIIRVPVAGKPISIVDLSGVPSDVVDVVVSVMCRLIFDFAVWSSKQKPLPVLLVCEEAHRYVPRDENLGFGPTKRAIAQIAREGRKYGVSLCLVSQRPADLSETILSQCNTFIALRMNNKEDQDYVARAMPESGLGLLNALPSLRTREAVIVGEGVTVPMRVRLRELEEEKRPRSANVAFSASWINDEVGLEFIGETLERWRKQVR